MAKRVGIAILGLGTVGMGVYRILEENKDYFEKNLNTSFEILYCYVRDINKKRDICTENIVLTNDVNQIANDSKVQICIECMGGSGTEETYEVVSKLIDSGKHMVMSSKKALALRMDEILKLVRDNHVEFRCDATVGGSIPICRMFKSISGYDYIEEMYGITNATTNYVLSLMREEELDFDRALDEARKRGYAENDVFDDINGWDALYKMVILLKMGCGIECDLNEMRPSNEMTFDTSFTENDDTRTKQIFYIKRVSEKSFDYYVGPVKIKPDSLLWNTEWNSNIIFVKHKFGGLRGYFGAGAGGIETASVMVEDLLDILSKI